MSNIFGRVLMQKPGRGKAVVAGFFAIGLGFYLAHPHFFNGAQTTMSSGSEAASTENMDPGQSFDLGDCTLRYLQAEGARDATIQIARDGKVLFKQAVSAGNFKLLNTDGADNSRNIYTAPLIETDERDVVAEVTGADDNHQYIVIKLSTDAGQTTAPYVVARLNTKNNTLKLLDGGKGNIFSLTTTDSFDGWGAESVSPTLNFRLLASKGKNPDTAHLEPIKSFIDVKLLRENLADLKGQFADLMVSDDAPITFAPASLADELANLIYAGHKQEALKLLDEVWPAQELSKKQRFWQAFLKEMQKSSNWQSVETLNGDLR